MRFLDNDVTEIAGARILGTTLWTDYALNVLLRRQAIGEMHKLMNDYRWINACHRRAALARSTRARYATAILFSVIGCRRNWQSPLMGRRSSSPTTLLHDVASRDVTPAK